MPVKQFFLSRPALSLTLAILATGFYLGVGMIFLNLINSYPNITEGFIMFFLIIFILPTMLIGLSSFIIKIFILLILISCFWFIAYHYLKKYAQIP